MKFKIIAILAIPVMLLVSCKNQDGRELAEYKAASTGDSLLYYYVQMRAHEYWEKANSDTILRSYEERQKFLEGFEKGVKLMGDDDTYNKGLRLGARLADNLYEFERKYGVDLNNEILIESYRNALRDNADLDALADQKEFYRLLDKMKAELRDKQRGEAMKELVKEAEGRKLEKISDNLYYKELRPGSGPNVKKGDIITVAVDYQRTDGDDLGLPSPITVTVGNEAMPIVMSEAYGKLSRGSSAVFATTASALFGSRTAMMGLQDNDVVIMSMILNDIVTPDDANYPISTMVPKQ